MSSSSRGRSGKAATMREEEEEFLQEAREDLIKLSAGHRSFHLFYDSYFRNGNSSITMEAWVERVADEYRQARSSRRWQALLKALMEQRPAFLIFFLKFLQPDSKERLTAAIQAPTFSSHSTQFLQRLLHFVHDLSSDFTYLKSSRLIQGRHDLAVKVIALCAVLIDFKRRLEAGETQESREEVQKPATERPSLRPQKQKKKTVVRRVPIQLSEEQEAQYRDVFGDDADLPTTAEVARDDIETLQAFQTVTSKAIIEWLIADDKLTSKVVNDFIKISISLPIPTPAVPRPVDTYAEKKPIPKTMSLTAPLATPAPPQSSRSTSSIPQTSSQLPPATVKPKIAIPPLASTKSDPGPSAPKPRQHSADPIASTSTSLSPPAPPLSALVPAPSAFPSIQPLRAAAEFKTPSKEFGSWFILMTGRAIADFRGLKDRVRLEAVEKKLKDLSFGYFGGDNQKRLVGTKTSVPIFEAKVLGDLRIVYQVDLSNPDVEGQVEQILRIWAVATHAQIDDRLWSAVSARSKFGKVHRQRCLHRSNAIISGSKSQQVTVPEKFPKIEEKIVESGAEEEMAFDDEMKLKVHAMLALSKFIPLTRIVLNSILSQDEDATFQFEVSPKEQDIIFHEKSSFLIGRSGTGKTTCILYKMLAIEETFEKSPEVLGGARVRQIFITQSPVLASKVKGYYHSLIETRSAGRLSADEAINLAKDRKKFEEKMEDMEDSAEALRGLPSKYSKLNDSHFPLFISLETLLYLLEGDFGIQWGKKRKETKGHKDAFKRYRLGDELEKLEVTLDEEDEEEPGVGVEEEESQSDQLSRLWEHYVDGNVFLSWFSGFDQRLTKGIDPMLCWSEILGTIRGSEEAVDTPKGYLTRMAYENLSTRAHSNYSKLRPRIYSIFEAYLKKMASHHDFDRADRTHTLLRALKKKALPTPEQMHFCFVDEAQDLLLADCTLLRHLSSNPDGFLYAGDTAQTISPGSAFRFNDLKAAVYRSEQVEAKQAGRPPPPVATMFSLAVNYRSHAGITRVGRSLVEALLQLFPESIDKLEPEEGIADGPRPCWVLPRERVGAEESYSGFLFGESGATVEFGAEQCILVRNEEARERLRAQIGEIGLIMTIAESKGLEFSDVLLFDFFSDSQATANQWRVLLNLFREAGEGVPTFDAVHHSLIGQDLRNLYVAVTRSRNVLWFVEREPEKGAAMMEYLCHKKLINVKQPTDELPIIAAASSPDKWRAQGMKFHRLKNYRLAALCFGKAGAHLEESIAFAYEERRLSQEAFKKVNEKTEAVKASYIRAAQSFRRCAVAAAQALDQEQAVIMYKVAAKCWVVSSKSGEAAEDYEYAGEFTLSAELYLEAKRHKDAVRAAKRPGVARATYDKVIKASRIQFLRLSKMEDARELFDTTEEQMAFMDHFGFDQARRSFYITLGDFAKAAALDHEEGKLQSAVNLYKKAGDEASSISAIECLLQLMSTQLPLGCSDYAENDTQPYELAAEYLRDADALLVQVATSSESLGKLSTNLELFRLIVSKSFDSLVDFASTSVKVRESEGNQLLALDVGLAHLPTFGANTSRSLVKTCLRQVKLYTRAVESFLRRGIDVTDQGTQQLFGLQLSGAADEAEDGATREVRIFATSPLATDEQNAAGISVTKEAPLVVDLAHDFLLSRCDDFLFGVSKALRSAGVLFPPCPRFAFTNECSDGRSCPREHAKGSTLTAALFQERISLLASVVELFGTYDVISGMAREPNEQAARQRVEDRDFWLKVVMESLYPTYPFAGGSSDIVDLKADGWNSLRPILLTRARDQLFNADYSTREIFNPFLRAAIIAGEFEKPSSFPNLSLPFARRFMALDFVHGPKGNHIVMWQITNYLRLPKDAKLDSHVLSGVAYAIRRVIDQGLQIDLSLLIHLLEDTLIATLPRTQGYHVDDWSYNQILLPRSLMRRLVRTHGERPHIEAELNTVLHLLDLTSKLGVSILRGSHVLDTLTLGQKARVSSHFHPVYGDKSVSSSSYLRHLYAYRLIRLCSLIGLRGANAVKERALRSIQAMSVVGAAHPLTTGYHNKNDWVTLEEALLNATPSLPLDPMMLLDLSPAADLKAALGVRVIRGTSLDIIRTQLFGTSLSAKAKPFIPKALQPAPLSNNKFSALEVDPDSSFVAEDDNEDQEAQAEQAREKVAIAEEKATIVLQRWIKKRLANKRARQLLDKSPVTKLWKEYCVASKRPIVRGPMVAMAFVVRTQQARLNSVAAKLRKAWLDPRVVNEAQTRNVEDVKRLKKDILPFVNLFKADSVLIQQSGVREIREQLKDLPHLCEEVDVILRRIQPSVDPSYAGMMELAVKGVLVAPKAKVAKKLEKVGLAREGDYIYGGDEDEDDEFEEEEAEKRGRAFA